MICTYTQKKSAMFLHTVYRLLIESKTLQLWVELIEDTPATHILVYVKGRGHIEVMNVHSMLSHGDTPMCQIWYAYVKKQRRFCRDTHSWWKYNFDIETKGQGCT